MGEQNYKTKTINSKHLRRHQYNDNNSSDNGNSSNSATKK